MATKKSKAPEVVPAPVVTPAPAQVVNVNLQPAPEAGKALSVRQQALAMVVDSRESQSYALEFAKGCKVLKRGIEQHWKEITSNVDNLKRSLLNMKNRDLQPVEDALAHLEKITITYENLEAERVRQVNRENERIAQEQARVRREQELADAEAEALRMEEQSDDLSPREKAFVAVVVMAKARGTWSPNAAANAAKTAGYKGDAAKAAGKLLATHKVNVAIAAAEAAAAIREQAAAVKSAPLEVVLAPVEQAQTGKAAGMSMRTTYSCEVVDVEALLQGVIDGTVPREALMPNESFLNIKAREAKELFSFPGCRLVKKQGLAG